MELNILLWRHMKLNLSSWNWNWISVSCLKFNFKAFPKKVKFSSWSSTFRFMVFVKNIGQWVTHHLGHWLPRRNIHSLSTTWHDVFNSACNWMTDIWSIYSRAALDISSSCLRLNSCRSYNVIQYLSINVISICSA